MDTLERVLSRPVAKPYRSNEIVSDVPYLNRDGHVDFAPGDVENPKNWSTRRRWYITAVSVLLVVNATFASSSPSGCLRGIAEEFHVSTEAAGLVMSLYLLGYCAGPLFWAPLSEFYGRRWIFYGTFLLYIAFNFLCSFTPTFAGLLVGRFLTGVFASSSMSNSPGVMADIWGPIERGNALALFATMTLAGPALGPVISGFLQLKLNWRWSFYVLLWFSGVTAVLMFSIPETLPSIVLQNKAKRIRRLKIPGYENVLAPVEASDRTLGGIFKVALLRPWIILFDIIALLVSIYTAITYTLMYMLFTIYPIVFQQKRGWNAGVGQLPLIGGVIGGIIGGIVIYLNSLRERKLENQGRKRKPEDRLYVAMAGGVMLPITMFWFSWGGQFNSVHWSVITVAGVFLVCSIMMIFVAYMSYITDCYLMYAASAVAVNTVTRSAGGAAAPLFTQQMYDALGVGVGGSVIGAIAAVLAVIPFMFFKYGERIRARSKFTPTDEDEPDSAETKDEEAALGRPTSMISFAIDSDCQPKENISRT